jgi:hypothetical protein
MKEMKVRITFTEPLLGTRPADPEIHTRFVASKAPDHKTMEQEVADLGAHEVEERGKTVFPRLEDGTPYIYDYQIKGFLKEAGKALRKVTGTKSSKLKAYRQEIDNLIFVGPRRIPLWMPIDLDLTATDNQRPLRASTPQGERVALAHSEEAPAGTYIECTFSCMVDSDIALVREWLDYGAWKGMGQWRNASYGRFEWEEV